MKWISVEDRLPEANDDEGIWSGYVTVWYLNKISGEEYFKGSCMYNHLNKSWDGTNGLSGNYDTQYEALFWTEKSVVDIIRESLPEPPADVIKLNPQGGE